VGQAPSETCHLWKQDYTEAQRTFEANSSLRLALWENLGEPTWGRTGERAGRLRGMVHGTYRRATRILRCKHHHVFLCAFQGPNLVTILSPIASPWFPDKPLRTVRMNSKVLLLNNQVFLLLVFHTDFLLDLLFASDNEGDMFLWNVSWFTMDYTSLYPRTQNSSESPLWEPQILHSFYYFIIIYSKKIHQVHEGIIYSWSAYETGNISVRFEVFMAVTMKNAIFWDVTPHGSCKSRRFGGT
jgi:hypothetical protein